jgi:hypothetical protein
LSSIWNSRLVSITRVLVAAGLPRWPAQTSALSVRHRSTAACATDSSRIAEAPSCTEFCAWNRSRKRAWHAHEFVQTFDTMSRSSLIRTGYRRADGRTEVFRRKRKNRPSATLTPSFDLSGRVRCTWQAGQELIRHSGASLNLSPCHPYLAIR